MIRRIFVLLPSLLALYAPLSAFAVGLTSETQTFDSEASAQAAGWAGLNNRDATLATDYGFSATNNAGAAGGEAGGQFTRVQTTIAYYADKSLGGTLSLDDPLAATGNIYVDNINAFFDEDVFVGWFDDNIAGGAYLGMRVFEPDDNLSTIDPFEAFPVIHFADNTLLFPALIAPVPQRTPSEFRINYDPSGGASGDGRLTIGVNAASVSVDLSAAQKALGGVFDSFGVGNLTLSADPNVPATQGTLFFDDLTYTTRVPEPGTLVLSVMVMGMVACRRLRRTGGYVNSVRKAAGRSKSPARLSYWPARPINALPNRLLVRRQELDLMIRPLVVLASFFVVLIIPPAAYSVTIFEHVGANDPVSEGWIQIGPDPGSGPVAEGPLINDQGRDAWFIDDDSLLNGSTLNFHRVPTALQHGQAASLGWSLASELRVVDAPDAAEFSVVLEYATGHTRYSLAIGAEADGDPIAFLWDGASDINFTGPRFTLQGGGSGYHIYEMKFDPANDLVDLLIDGVERLSNFGGHAFETPQDRVVWGSGASLDIGHANYAWVRWSIVPEPGTLVLMIMAMGMVGATARQWP